MVRYGVEATELIRIRRSWRTFQEQPLTQDHTKNLTSFIEDLDPPPFGTGIRFELIDTGSTLKRFSGTYGVAKGARTFLAGAAHPGTRTEEDFGYLFEAILLRATELGLGTCWMGGTFNSGFFADRILRTADEIIPAVSPVGYPASARSVVDSLFAASAGSRRRKPGESLFFTERFGVPLDVENHPYRIPLEMVRLAPSASNRQPWRILATGDVFHFFVQRSLGYKALFREVDMQRIDLGIAMLHFELGSSELGLGGRWEEHDPALNDLPARTQYIVSWVPD
ncbi:MAG TPA: nitroreductase [Deltaproteobacteria bacterium]|nr:nitroreductase [Deltaproteobacteria bacterium]